MNYGLLSMNSKLFSILSITSHDTARRPRRQLFSFLIVGLANTAFSYALYAFFLSLGTDYKLANLVALVISIVTGFKLQGTYVFANKSNRLIFRYIALWIVLYWLNITLIGLLQDHGFNSYLAGAIALAPIVGLSFVLQKYVVFRGQS